MLSILALACPPLAVWIAGSAAEAALNVGLSLLYFPGVAHALAVVSRARTERRTQQLLDAIPNYYR